MFSRAGDSAECHLRYSRHHCLARIPKSAEERLKIRLRNQSVLTATADPGAWKEAERGREDAVVFKNGAASGMVASLKTRMDNSWTVV